MTMVNKVGDPFRIGGCNITHGPYHLLSNAEWIYLDIWLDFILQSTNQS